MSIEQHLLKIQLREAIGKRTVQAAVFFTFNFEPVFFENYVLPLLMPEPGRFKDSSIANQLLWREHLRRGEIPPITVYCDYHAKNNTEAPALGYEVRCLRLPEATNTICNFHPKHVFILLNDDSLLLVTGSGNITPAGWCQNVEVFHLHKFRHEAGQRPFTQRTNFLQRQFLTLSNLLRLELSPAEQLLQDRSLRYFSDDTLPRVMQSRYFSSLFEPFTDFLKREVFQKEAIERVEIISPYFSTDTACIEFLQKNGIAETRFLLPTTPVKNEILMDENTFKALSKKGARWHHWAENALSERYTHAKVYRFYGPRRVFTILGSVNFTNPAWGGFSNSKNNSANVETAVLLHEQARNTSILLSDKAADTSQMRFVSKTDLENATEFLEVRARRNAPELKFIIDWKAAVLKLEFLSDKGRGRLFFKNPLPEIALLKNESFPLDATALRRLAKNSLIEVLERLRDGKEYSHFYYPDQQNFEQRPLPFRLTTGSILQCWDQLDNKGLALEQSLRLAEHTDEDSGELDNTLFDSPSLLNEWAQYFNGLVKLERFLFSEKHRKSDRNEQDKDITWFLLHRSFETLPTFLDELQAQYEEGKLYRSFYWTILQIISQNFYERAFKRFDKTQGKIFRETAGQLAKTADNCLKLIETTELERWKWLREKLKLSI